MPVSSNPPPSSPSPKQQGPQDCPRACHPDLCGHEVLEHLVLYHLKSITGPLLDPLQFIFRQTGLYTTQSMWPFITSSSTWTIQKPMPGLFVDFSFAFYTIILVLLQDQNALDSTCRWIIDFFSDRSQHMKLGTHVTDSLTISTNSPQGCVLSPLLPVHQQLHLQASVCHGSAAGGGHHPHWAHLWWE